MKWIALALSGFLVLVAVAGCSQKDLLQKFSSPEDQAAAKSYIDFLRAHNFDKIEEALDLSIRTPDIRGTLTQMAELIPNQKPVSIKLVGAQTYVSSDAKTVNTTFEYNFGNKWLLANVAIRNRHGTKTIVGFNVNPIAQSLESQNRFTLADKSPIHYTVLVAAIAAVLITLYSLIVCARTKLPRRKWFWIFFILFGFGKVAVNWTTGKLALAPLSLQLFSASAFASPYGPWSIAVSFPLGAIAFIFYKRTRLARQTED